MRVRLDYTQTDGFLSGNRIYLGYGGSAPTPGNCAAIASAISTAWESHIAPFVMPAVALTEIDVLDITTLTGSSGQWTGDIAGSQSGTAGPIQTAVNVEFGIARRYRGGKPRIFFPPTSVENQQNGGQWTDTFVANFTTDVEAFFAAVEAISVGAVGALNHVNVSYYQGFKNITNSSGRERAVPQYRNSALVESVESYIVKKQLGSQRRRRTATTS